MKYGMRLEVEPRELGIYVYVKTSKAVDKLLCKDLPKSSLLLSKKLSLES